MEVNKGAEDPGSSEILAALPGSWLLLDPGLRILAAGRELSAQKAFSDCGGRPVLDVLVPTRGTASDLVVFLEGLRATAGEGVFPVPCRAAADGGGSWRVFARTAGTAMVLGLEPASQVAGQLTGLSSLVLRDVSNLVTVMLGHTSMLLADLPPDSPLRAPLEEALQAGQRAARLTREIVKQSAPSSPRQQVDLCARLGEIQPMLRRVLGDAVELRLELAVGQCRITLDWAEFEHSWLALANHVHEHLPAGGSVLVRAGTTLAAPPGLAPAARVECYLHLVVQVRAHARKAGAGGALFGAAGRDGAVVLPPELERMRKCVQDLSGDLRGHCGRDGTEVLEVLLPCDDGAEPK